MNKSPFTDDELASICYGSPPAGWKVAPYGEAKIIDKGRWSCIYEVVVTNGRQEFWRISWSEGATEYQNQGPEGIEIVKVKAYPLTIVEYQEIAE